MSRIARNPLNSSECCRMLSTTSLPARRTSEQPVCLIRLQPSADRRQHRPSGLNGLVLRHSDTHFRHKNLCPSGIGAGKCDTYPVRLRGKGTSYEIPWGGISLVSILKPPTQSPTRAGSEGLISWNSFPWGDSSQQTRAPNSAGDASSSGLYLHPGDVSGSAAARGSDGSADGDSAGDAGIRSDKSARPVTRRLHRHYHHSPFPPVSSTRRNAGHTAPRIPALTGHNSNRDLKKTVNIKD